MLLPRVGLFFCFFVFYCQYYCQMPGLSLEGLTQLSVGLANPCPSSHIKPLGLLPNVGIFLEKASQG